MISDCTPTTCESAVCFSAEIFFSGVCRNCLLSCFLLCRRMPHKAQLWEWITKGNTRIKCAQMRANACFGTRFLTRVCAKIVRAFCVCVGRLSLTCTVFRRTTLFWESTDKYVCVIFSLTRLENRKQSQHRVVCENYVVWVWALIWWVTVFSLIVHLIFVIAQG